MLFVVTLTYRAPQQAIDAQLDAHRAWLAAHLASGRFIVAGPLAPGTGGLIVAQGDSRAELDAVLSTDPFVALGLVDVAVLACTPAMRHAAFPEQWRQPPGHWLTDTERKSTCAARLDRASPGCSP